MRPQHELCGSRARGDSSPARSRFQKSLHLLPATNLRRPGDFERMVVRSRSARQARGPAPAVPSGEDLRAPEVIGRVWIAPFVDAGGIYREGAYVRLVIEPARWRLR